MYQKFSLILVSLYLFAFSNAFGQQNTRSPYSLFGVGVLHYDGFADNASNGRNGISYRHSSNYSFTNPASLSALKYSTFNAAAYMDLGQFKTTQYNQDFSNAGFNYIALAVPLAKYKSGLAFGLLPYSDVGYNIINVKDSSGTTLRNEFEGNGGLSKFNLGLGSMVWKYLSLGANYSFTFGQLNEIQSRRYPGSIYMTSYEDRSNLFLKGHRLDLGLQFHTTSDSGLNHTIGFNFSSSSNLKGELSRTVRTFTEVADGVEISRDTLINTTGETAKVILPNSLKLSYTLGKGEKWQATLGYNTTKWSAYKNVFGNNSGLKDEQSLSLGVFICQFAHYDNTIKANKVGRYLQSIRYSAGFYHSDGYISAFDHKIAENALSIGLGFPFTKVHKGIDGSKIKVTSRLFLTGEFVRRGTMNNNLIQEDFFKLTLGLNFADKWFNKRLFN
jgi:hypothetical protein